MNINKKLDRVKQWAGEKMGQEAKTGVSEEFKALEMEMTLRHEGLYSTPFCQGPSPIDRSQVWRSCRNPPPFMSSPCRNAMRAKTRRRYSQWATWVKR
jgi:hypothetical protein